MNDTINPASTNSSKTSTAGALSRINAAVEGKNGEDAADSSVSEDSFHDLIHNTVEDTSTENGNTKAESGGKVLPVAKDSSDDSAEDGRQISMLNFTIQPHLSEKQNQINQSSIDHSKSILLGAGSGAEDELNGLNSQLRQFLKLEPKVDAQKVNGQQILTPGSNINTTKNAIENPVMQSPDMSQLSAEQLESLHHKNHVLTTTTNQQQVLPNIQTSLLLQTVATQGEFNPDTLPIVVNAASNSTAATSLQSIPQAEIVETFARPGWSQGMGKQVVWMVQQNISSAEIRLNPAHLGPIEVRIDMAEDQVNVALSSRHAVVREAMELALPKLREMFDDNGLNLAGTDISQHSFAEQREHKTAGNNASLSSDSVDQALSSEISEQVITQIPISTAMVDYYI